MNIVTTPIPGVLILEPKVFQDARGYFYEPYNEKVFAHCGIRQAFVQDNESYSARGVLRGLHFQIPPFVQAKLVRVIQGEVFDVVVDIRRGSATYGRQFSMVLNDKDKKMLFIPEGFAHGICILSETALFAYKVSGFYSPQQERGVAWNDPDLGIDWPLANLPVLSAKDREYPRLKDLPAYF